MDFQTLRAEGHRRTLAGKRSHGEPDSSEDVLRDLMNTFPWHARLTMLHKTETDDPRARASSEQGDKHVFFDWVRDWQLGSL